MPLLSALPQVLARPLRRALPPHRQAALQQVLVRLPSQPPVRRAAPALHPPPQRRQRQAMPAHPLPGPQVVSLQLPGPVLALLRPRRLRQAWAHPQPRPWAQLLLRGQRPLSVNLLAQLVLQLA